MPYSTNTIKYINAIMEKEALHAVDECHATAKNIVQQLGQPHSQPTERLDGNHDADGVYRLDIKTTGVDVIQRWAWNFDHSLAILKCGADLVLFQSFSRAYNLGEWLMASGRLNASKCAEMYSPFSQQSKLGSINEWLRRLNQSVPVFNQKKWADFEPLAKHLFGSGLSVSFRASNAAPADIALSFRWRRYGLKPVPVPM